MLEFYEPGAAIIEDSIAKAVTRSTKANKSAFKFVSGAQAAIVEEIIFTNHEIFDRIQTIPHVGSAYFIFANHNNHGVCDDICVPRVYYGSLLLRFRWLA